MIDYLICYISYKVTIELQRWIDLLPFSKRGKRKTPTKIPFGNTKNQFHIKFPLLFDEKGRQINSAEAQSANKCALNEIPLKLL